MKYSEGYKYVTEEDLSILVPPYLYNTVPTITHLYTCYADYQPFDDSGSKVMELLVKEGYAWDGPSGPVPDTKRNMFPSLIHDVWYQLIREHHMPMCTRVQSDRWFGELCKQSGTPKWLANGYVTVLNRCGEKYAREVKPILEMN